MSKIPNKILSGTLPIRTITDHIIVDINDGGKLIAADPDSNIDGYIGIYLPASLPPGFSFEVMKVSVGDVYFIAYGSAIYNTDTAITNQFELVKVISGVVVADDWILEGNLEPLPVGIPNELTYYWSIESVSTTGSNIDSWIERKKAVGDNWAQTGANRPTVATLGGPGGTVDALAFNGSSQFFPRFVLSAPIAQTCFFTICMDELTGGGGEGFVFDDTPASSYFMMRMSYGAMNCYTGGGGSFDVVTIPSLPASWFVLTVYCDGVSTKAILNGGAWSSSIALGGTNGINGLAFGQRSNNAIRGTMRVTDFGIGAGTQANAETVHNYIRTLRGL